MNKLLVILLGLSLMACQKKPDAPLPAPAANPPATQPPSQPTTQPPPVTQCQGATVTWSLPGGQTINDNSVKDFTVPGFEYSCGDSLRVYIRNPQCSGAGCWTELHDTNNGATFYSVLNQTVTIHNSTGIVMEVAIEAILL